MNARTELLMKPEPGTLSERRADALAGALIGTAVGDALGLPMEGLSARRQHRMFGSELRHRLVGPYGMVSDDTEHTFMVGQALLDFPNDSEGFQQCLAKKLRWWLMGLPAGVGYATLRAILKLWLGISPSRSGVFSAGNGPSMRSAILGVYFCEDTVRREEFIRASAEITHRDPRALTAALAVGEAAAWMTIGSHDPADLLRKLEALDNNVEWTKLVKELAGALEREEATEHFAKTCGCHGAVSGYAFHTVPVALYAALRHRDDFESALSEIIACGGDTDTTGAIVGALVGAHLGPSGIPRQWQDNIVEWPRSLTALTALAGKLAEQSSKPLGALSYGWPFLLLRNLAFLAVILAHGFRRIFPPY